MGSTTVHTATSRCWQNTEKNVPELIEKTWLNVKPDIFQSGSP